MYKSWFLAMNHHNLFDHLHSLAFVFQMGMKTIQKSRLASGLSPALIYLVCTCTPGAGYSCRCWFRSLLLSQKQALLMPFVFQFCTTDFEDVPQVERMYLVFTSMPGSSYQAAVTVSVVVPLVIHMKSVKLYWLPFLHKKKKEHLSLNARLYIKSCFPGSFSHSQL